jgi:hypothetical protein
MAPIYCDHSTYGFTPQNVSLREKTPVIQTRRPLSATTWRQSPVGPCNGNESEPRERVRTPKMRQNRFTCRSTKGRTHFEVLTGRIETTGQRRGKALAIVRDLDGLGDICRTGCEGCFTSSKKDRFGPVPSSPLQKRLFPHTLAVSNYAGPCCNRRSGAES